MSGGEHWFDRLAEAPHTRRHGFKVALAGAVATLPFVGGRRAEASHSDCHKPCVYTSQKQSADRKERCSAVLGSEGIAQPLLAFFYLNPAAAVGRQGQAFMNYVGCREAANLRHKAAQFDCLQGGCGGYTPDPKVLCPGCLEVGGKCCPDRNSGGLSGYTCCPCCKPDGTGCQACG